MRNCLQSLLALQQKNRRLRNKKTVKRNCFVTLISCSTRINHFSHKFRNDFVGMCVSVCFVCNVRSQIETLPLAVCYLVSELMIRENFWWNASSQNNLKSVCYIVSTILSPLIIEINWKIDRKSAAKIERRRTIQKVVNLLLLFLLESVFVLAKELFYSIRNDETQRKKNGNAFNRSVDYCARFCQLVDGRHFLVANFTSLLPRI